MNNEIGRELAPAELEVRQIVVVAPPGHDIGLTMWVEAIDADNVVFYSGMARWRVINFIKDGKIVDDQDRTVRVFQYLGEA